MPAFPERESSILALLKRKKPGRVPESVEGKEDKSPAPSPINASQVKIYPCIFIMKVKVFEYICDSNS